MRVWKSVLFNCKLLHQFPPVFQVFQDHGKDHTIHTRISRSYHQLYNSKFHSKCCVWIISLNFHKTLMKERLELASGRSKAVVINKQTQTPGIWLESSCSQSLQSSHPFEGSWFLLILVIKLLQV